MTTLANQLFHLLLPVSKKSFVLLRCSKIIRIMVELSEQEMIRRNSLEQLRQMGINPYPAAEYITDAFSKEIKESFKDDAEPCCLM